MIGEPYRQQLRSQAQSSTFRWWRGVPASSPNAAGAERDGRVYVEQTVNPAWRVAPYSTLDTMQSEQFGLINVGSSGIVYMPDEIQPSREDRFVLLALTETDWVTLTRGAGATDPLPQPYPVRLESVMQDATSYTAGMNCQLSGATVQWLSGGPAAGTKYAALLTHHPLWFVTGEGNSMAQLGSDGVPLPRTVELEQVTPSKGAS